MWQFLGLEWSYWLGGAVLLIVYAMCLKFNITIKPHSRNHQIAALTATSVYIFWVLGVFGAIGQFLMSAGETTSKILSGLFGAIGQFLMSAGETTSKILSGFFGTIGQFLMSAGETTSKILSGFFGAIGQFLASAADFVVWAITTLGIIVSLSTLILLVLTFVIKYREDLLVALLGTAVVTKTKTYLGGIWIIMSSIIAWIGIINPGSVLSQNVTIQMPEYVAICLTAIIGWAVAAMIRNAIKLVKYYVGAKQNPTAQVG